MARIIDLNQRVLPFLVGPISASSVDYSPVLVKSELD